jgi:hypothetical protein
MIKDLKILPKVQKHIGAAIPKVAHWMQIDLFKMQVRHYCEHFSHVGTPLSKNPSGQLQNG